MSKPDENNKKSASTQLAVGISVAFAVGLAVGAIVVWMIQLRSNRGQNPFRVRYQDYGTI